MQAHRQSLQLAIALAALCTGNPAAAKLSPQQPSQPLMATSSSPLSTLLGHAMLTSSVVDEHMQAGKQALNERIFGKAEAHFNAALAELRKHNEHGARTVQATIGLASALLGGEKLEHAERLFSECTRKARDLGDEHLQVVALSGQAEALRELGETVRARAACEQALKLAETEHIGTTLEHARLLETLGGLVSAQGLNSQAVRTYRDALQLANDEHSDNDIADIEYKLAIELKHDGAANQEEAETLFKKTFAYQDSHTELQMPLAAAPRAVARWEAGNPRARQVADSEYPLKYVLIGNLRVAATPVRSENVIGVIISLSNCGRSRLQLAIGPVSFEQLQPHRKPFLYVSPRELDVPLEEQHITELTWRRRWLNHIEKTRFIPGYLKDNVLDADNFFGNNTFGSYGDWPTIACDQTPIVTREEFLYGKQRLRDAATANFLSVSGSGYRPTYLDAGDSKTGLVFFKQERFDKAKLNIVIGNAVVEIPFDSAGPR